MNLNHLFSVMNTAALAEKSQPDIKSHSVILANSQNLILVDNLSTVAEVVSVAANDYFKLAAQIEPLNKGITEIIIPTPLGGGDMVNTQIEDRQASPQIEESSSPEVLGEVKPEPQKNGAAPKLYGDDISPKNGDNRVGRNNSFNQRKEQLVHQQGEREPVQAQPHTATELNTLLTRYEKALFHHLLACLYCHIEKAQYCYDGDTIGKRYDALLMGREDAQARRESLALRVDKACISGRSVFVPFGSSDASPPPNTVPQTRKYGNTQAYEAFINHWMACDVCKPNLNRYCDEGQRLEKEANR